jgi:L-iditol 2-dehydrogenase
MWGPGGFSEYMTVKNYEVFKVSGNVDPAVATLAEPIACVIRSVERGALEIGDSALVIGGGVMGLIHTILAKKQGNRVFLSEPDAMRRKMAEQLGADIVIDPTKDNVAEIVRKHTEGRGCEAVFFTAGGVSAIQTGISSLVKNGRMVIYGATGSEHELILDPAVFHYDEIYLTGVTKHTKDSFRKAAVMLSGNSELFAGLISERYPFSDIRHAFERSELMDTFRVVLDM